MSTTPANNDKEKSPPKQLEPHIAEEILRLGKRIRALREGKKLSQGELAEKAGFSTKYLGEVERGGGNITIELLTKLAIALEVPIGELLDHQHEQRPEVLIAEIVRLAPLLTAKDAQTTYRIMKMFAEG